MLPPPDFVPDAVLERRAMDLLREHERTTATSIALPVPIEAIVERTLDLRVLWLPIEEQPGEIILARIDPNYLGRPTIQMNENRVAHFEEYFGTEQFSLAHEAGHWVLHYGRGRSHQLAFPAAMDDPGLAPILCRRMSDGDRREVQADRFAAFLLLPEHLLRSVAGRHDLSRWAAISLLARDCGVSKRAMTRRLESLGLIRLDPTSEPQTAALTIEPRLPRLF